MVFDIVGSLSTVTLDITYPVLNQTARVHMLSETFGIFVTKVESLELCYLNSL